MTNQQNKTNSNSLRVVTNVSISQRGLKIEFAKVTFSGELEIIKLDDQYMRLYQDPSGKWRFR